MNYLYSVIPAVQMTIFFHVLIMGVDVALNYSSIRTCQFGMSDAAVTHQDVKQVQWVFHKILP